MYQFLIYLHSYVRWFVLVSLFLAVWKACSGYFFKRKFTKGDNAVRHWTATIAHIQLMAGMTLYFQSPLIKYFLKNGNKTMEDAGYLFFGIIHSTLMLVAIVIVTVGSALTKRKQTDEQKFKTMLLWYSLALVIIFIAIPWPFSPFANRPYIR
ncbi:hypothetical protein [Longitalea luteola]|uniref:hypothetical protein n=1 Tax=Longitalea luteola TaxID=2812563 RepID=UPI001A96AB6A|nr:hypothetical protein [Longitalea luteola]